MTVLTTKSTNLHRDTENLWPLLPANLGPSLAPNGRGWKHLCTLYHQPLALLCWPWLAVKPLLSQAAFHTPSWVGQRVDFMICCFLSSSNLKLCWSFDRAGCWSCSSFVQSAVDPFTEGINRGIQLLPAFAETLTLWSENKSFSSKDLALKFLCLA